MVAMKWTLEEFDRQPFALIVELLEYFEQHPPEHIATAALAGWKPKPKMKQQRIQNEDEFKRAGMLPTPQNTIGSESGLPDWVKEARQLERAKKVVEAARG